MTEFLAGCRCSCRIPTQKRLNRGEKIASVLSEQQALLPGFCGGTFWQPVFNQGSCAFRELLQMELWSLQGSLPSATLKRRAVCMSFHSHFLM